MRDSQPSLIERVGVIPLVGGAAFASFAPASYYFDSRHLMSFEAMVLLSVSLFVVGTALLWMHGWGGVARAE